jgi:hypothetical protein
VPIPEKPEPKATEPQKPETPKEEPQKIREEDFKSFQDWLSGLIK